MAEYIKKEAALAAVRNVRLGVEAIKKIPAVDAEEVVRCKNCRNSDWVGDTLYCFHWERNTEENGYCHEG